MMYEELKSRAPSFLFLSCALTTLLVIILLLALISYEAFPVLKSQGIYFLIGSVWDYGKHVYGIRIFLISTLIVTTVTLIMAVPIGVFTAVYLAEFASVKVASIIKPFIELLVGIPSVVYGIFGFRVLGKFYGDSLAPFISEHLGFIPIFHNPGGYAGQGVFLASTILAIMILPTIIAISENSIRSVPYEFKEASLALGSTHWETIKLVLLPVARGGILTSIVLGIMRAVGETMAVVMLIGCSIHIPNSIFDIGYPMTSKILNDFSGESSTPESINALFAMAAVLFLIEIFLVVIVRKVGERK